VKDRREREHDVILERCEAEWLIDDRDLDR
jgi:hypothetical protein